MDEQTPLMDGPIPGQSLTTEIGSRPWQQPSKLNTVEEALEHYATKITDPQINDSLLDALEMGTPVSSIAEIVVQSGAMEGIHTIDVSILVLPVIMELIAYVADEAEIDYNMGTEESIDQDIVPEGKIAMVMQKLKNKKPELKENEPVEMAEESPPVSGLMARRV
tara:strand:- start:18 stop:512 length:495 start_codon:yes stop_codon:yes gene_type:complete